MSGGGGEGEGRVGGREMMGGRRERREYSEGHFNTPVLPDTSGMARASLRSHNCTAPSSYPNAAHFPFWYTNYLHSHKHFASQTENSPCESIATQVFLPQCLSKVLQSPEGTFHIQPVPSAVPARRTCACGCHCVHCKKGREGSSIYK